ncbi:uncharacterized protein F5891DRAFT_1000372 [Suillus fuscotomentosus]|uniref:MARVEL domain-containing protein n=1 Tax=Suillus fuscotomentosus TaxID=1912939 RepID=A0AAD4ELF1_9AGAM|nr:uncharacterized protein F5891DRAFT_1000372 [Suillus fuscotomentosus]KAG1907173.1 hypothetical protein F5891DRAFT_1000372 [Suillus fuscotomentosus]
MRPARPLPLNCQHQSTRQHNQPPQHHYTRERQTSRRKRLPTLSISRIFTGKAMPSKFNIFRTCIYGVVFIWTLICLGIAAHFQSLLVITDLTRFVPFTIFVCSVSMLILIILLGCSMVRTSNPISTRIELGCLGLLGTFWLALGAFLASSDSENANVECYSSDAETSPIDVPGFSTETYQAQYRVLEAFSLFNLILILVFLLFLLALAVKHHFRVNRNVWYIAVTEYPWFGKTMSKLPAPVSSRSRSRGKTYDEKASAPWENETRRGDSRYPGWSAQVPAPARASDKYKRDASPRR